MLPSHVAMCQKVRDINKEAIVALKTCGVKRYVIVLDVNNN